MAADDLLKKYGLQDALSKLDADEADYVVVVRQKGEKPTLLCYSFWRADDAPEMPDCDSPEYDEFTAKDVRDFVESGIKQMTEEAAENRARWERMRAKRVG